MPCNGIRWSLRGLLLAALAAVAMTAPGAAHAYTPTPSQQACQEGPLSTEGSKIVNRSGTECVLTGVNWFGFETQNHVVHGLWTRGYDEMLAQISELGFNTIRMPFSIEAIESGQMTSIDYAAGRNADLQGKSPLEAMEIIIDAAAEHGLLVLPDLHSLKDDNYLHGLWYDDRYSERDFSRAWETMAKRFGSKANVIGADLKNEPHGEASWGDGTQTDWRAEAERIGNEIHRDAPDWLIVVEGIEGPTDGQQLDSHWWGGNLEGARPNPVELDQPGKVVYSPHEYGPGVWPQPWFDEDDFTDTLYDRWTKGFAYILDQEIAPVLVGEFGGRETGTDTKEGRWQRQFMDYLSQRGISFTYWAWNPNSGDTGGVLGEDWRTVDAEKVDLLQRVMRGERIDFTGEGDPAPIPDPTPDPEPDPVPDPGTTPDDVTAELLIDSDWGSGYCVTLKAANASDQEITGLGFVLDMPGTIGSSWNGTLSDDTGTIAIALPEWGSTLASGASYTSTGFCATGAKPAGVVATFDGAPVPDPEPAPDPSPGPEPEPAPEPAGIVTKIQLDSDWGSGYCVTLRAKNESGARITDLGFRFEMPGTITSSWNGSLSGDERVTVTLPGWASTLEAGATYDSTGFCASGAKPTNLVALLDGNEAA